MPENISNHLKQFKADIEKFLLELGDLTSTQIREKSLDRGYYRLAQPEKYGGLNASHLQLAIAREAVASAGIEKTNDVIGPEPGMLAETTKHLENNYLFPMLSGAKTGSFAFTKEDILRAHQFFEKHELEYYGLYHTHPNGAAYPSVQDIETGHRYHFILSLADPNQPIFAAYEIINRQPTYIPIVVTDRDVHSKDIHSKKSNKKETSLEEVPSHLKNKSPEEDAIELSQKIHDIKEDNPLPNPFFILKASIKLHFQKFHVYLKILLLN